MAIVTDTGRVLGNRLRLLRHRRSGYVIVTLTGAFPERTAIHRRRFPFSLLPWPAPPPSIEALNDTMQRLAHDSRVSGAILHVSGLALGPATAMSLRQAVDSFRASGKRAIFYLNQTSFWPYVVASVGDMVITPESCSFFAAGLWAETIFLRDALALAGIQADFEAIAEYKVSPDTFRRATMSGPHREMLESIVDSMHRTGIQAIASGRALEPDYVRACLDRSPMSAAEALDAGLLDAVAYEDELPTILGSPGAPADLVTWDDASRWVIHRQQRSTRKAIGVISVEGVIVEGTSRHSPMPFPMPLPFSADQAGSHSIIQQLRAAARNKRLAAVILCIDSPGGSALAADLIWREVAGLASIKPVVAYMSNRAASGGYYVAAAAQAIVAQDTTLTGSIGIWGGKLVTKGLYDKLGANRQVISRGAAAGLYADVAEFSDAERDRIRKDLGLGYARFKARVSQGRGLDSEQVEHTARGRVWTGEQAVALGLVDECGGFATAVARAKALAGLDPTRHTPVLPVLTPKSSQQPLHLAQDAADFAAAMASLLHQGALALAPWQIHIRG